MVLSCKNGIPWKKQVSRLKPCISGQQPLGFGCAHTSLFVTQNIKKTFPQGLEFNKTVHFPALSRPFWSKTDISTFYKFFQNFYFLCGFIMASVCGGGETTTTNTVSANELAFGGCHSVEKAINTLVLLWQSFCPHGQPPPSPCHGHPRPMDWPTFWEPPI